MSTARQDSTTTMSTAGQNSGTTMSTVGQDSATTMSTARQVSAEAMSIARIMRNVTNNYTSNINYRIYVIINEKKIGKIHM